MAEPYYMSRLTTLYVGDCRDVAPDLPARSIDLIIADPPYGVSWRSNRRIEKFDAMTGDDGLTDWPVVLGDIVRRLLADARHVYVFGYEPDQIAKLLDLGATAELIWNKDHIGMGNLTQPWGPEHEKFSFGVHTTRPAGRGRGDGRLSARLRQGSVIRAPRANAGSVRHPDEKPVRLLRQLVESSSVLGDTVLDPTCGVGSTGVAAILAGRRFVGIELDRRYADIAVARLKAAEQLAIQAEVA